MKRIVTIAIPILALAAGAFAQEPSDAVHKALMAAPIGPRLKAEDVTVIKWKPDFTYETLQTGSSSLVCYDLSGYPGHLPFTVECTSKGNLPRVAQNLKFEAMGDRKTVQAALQKAEEDGTRVKPEFGSAWIHLMGPDAEHARKHTTIAVPGATAQSLGLPDKPSQDGAWIMNAGSSTAHIMIPGS
jgi:hypothetical protein